MDMQHISRKLSRAWRAFRSDRSGNVAIIFGLAMIPLLGLVGVAVDYSRANADRVKLQAAVDSAGLMLAKDPKLSTMSQSERDDKANKYFQAVFKPKDIDPATITVETTYDAAKRSMDMKATAIVRNTPFYLTLNRWLKGNDDGKMKIGSSSTVKWGSRLRVAMALDTTGSMNDDGKIGALKTAVAGTGGAIDQLSALNLNDGDVYISIVPFAVHVNGGPANYDQSWLDFTQWKAQ